MNETSNEHAVPVLSIIIPTYNRLPLLQESIATFDGKLTCTYEVLIIDDGSTDGTPEFLRHLALPFRIFLCEHQGGQAARNTGQKAARGRYIKFLDDDDLLNPVVTEAQIAYLDANPHIDVCYSDWEVMVQTREGSVQTRFHIMKDVADALDALIMEWWCAPFAYLFRKECLADVEWDTTLPVVQDFAFAVEVAMHDAVFGYFPTAPESIGKYRENRSDESRITISTPLLKRAHYENIVLDKIKDELQASNRLTEHRRRLLARRYFKIAHRVFPLDKPMFRQMLKTALTLNPRLKVYSAPYSWVADWLGYETAEWLRYLTLRTKTKLRFLKRRKISDNKSEVIYVRFYEYDEAHPDY
jgi:glycosyltransferase involved in cell wall biosynthesis